MSTDSLPRTAQVGGPNGPLGRHVWLVDAPGHPGRWPSILAAWRRTTAGHWEAAVVLVGQQENLYPSEHSMWVNERHVEPLDLSKQGGWVPEILMPENRLKL